MRNSSTEKVSALANAALTFVEGGEVDSAVATCLRLSRLCGDTANTIAFIREMYPDPEQLRAAFLEETRDLGAEERQRVWCATQDAWLAERTTNRAPLAEDDEPQVLALGVGEIIHEIDSMTRMFEDLAPPAGMSAFDRGIFRSPSAAEGAGADEDSGVQRDPGEDQNARLIYASRIEGQRSAEERVEHLPGQIQTEVHNYYAERAPQVFESLKKAAELLPSSSAENHALLLTAIRRALKGAADHHFPAVEGPVVCRDGVERKLGDAEYLNRLQEFCLRDLAANSSRDLLEAEFQYLMAFARKLNSIASKGVHAHVTREEARQGLVGVVMFLSNLTSRLVARPGH